MIENVRKPQWHQAVSWTDPQLGIVWRADEVDLTSPVLGGLTGLHEPIPDLAGGPWWTAYGTRSPSSVDIPLSVRGSIRPR